MENVNPYQPPEGKVGDEIHYGELKLLSAKGRIGRLRYIGYSMGLGILVAVVMGVGAGLIAASGSDTVAMVLGLIGAVIYLFTIGISIMWGIQRLHDFNAKGWLVLLTLIPLVNLVMILVLWILPGTEGANNFGNQPPPNTLGIKLLALVLPVIFILGIVAAIAVPAYQQYILRAQEMTQSMGE